MFKKIIISLGEICVLILSYLTAPLFVPGQKNTLALAQYRWKFVVADLSPANCFKMHTPIFMIIFSLFYASIVLLIIFSKKMRMPGREYGTSSLISPKTLNKKLADLNDSPNDIHNEVVSIINYSWFDKLKDRFKHRKDD